jgi:DNA-binding PadR family transcriptional regulator
MFRHFHEQGDFGPSRFFEKGNLKYVILDLLKDSPSHGYEIIRKLEEVSHGFYSPSAGSVYPTLQLLEDMGYVKATEQDGKKVYAITDEGKKYLQEHEETIHKIKEHVHGWWGASGLHEEFRDMMHEFRGLARELVGKGRRIQPEKISRIKEILVKAKTDIAQVLKE